MRFDYTNVKILIIDENSYYRLEDAGALQEVLMMMPTEKPSNSKQAKAKTKKTKHRRRKEIYLQRGGNIGVPKQPLRSRSPEPTHEKSRNWEAAS
ncbi:hypothetical protein [Acaryochloris sp. CCMEE 5410]|uniref:hypothetical protein n=1 Tax=Acaryochloris sp. CCMEE 5410 TaxID=310037 RepID=UPI0002483A22|nr:hypothetical protein [Acaryochloris sp. CCMEE 5410]KAI9132044.1 hypothetical protein ON05_000575 [Acaryochloris sp. CCMEE 5410]